MNHDHRPGTERHNGTKARTKWVFIGFAVIAVYFLLTEHRAHVIEYLPFLLLLACPLMHLFHGHGSHGGHGSHDESEKPIGPNRGANTAKADKKYAGGCH